MGDIYDWFHVLKEKDQFELEIEEFDQEKEKWVSPNK